MANRPETPFRPARLDRRDLEASLTAGMRRFPDEEMRRLHAEKVAWFRRLEPFGPRVRRRLGNQAVAAALLVPLLHGILHGLVRVGPGFGALWLQVPLSALYGAWAAWRPPPGWVLGLALFGIFALAAGAAGRTVLHPMTPCVFLLDVALGMVVTVADEARRMDGSA